MSLKDKWFKKKVDERQEMDLLRVEHFGFWLMYYMLLAAILIQTFFFDNGMKMAAAEWIIFMTISIICVIGWVRKGVWNYQRRKVPGVRACLFYSISASLVFGTVFGILFSFKSDDTDLISIAKRIIIMVVFLFVINLPTFLIVRTVAKHREKKLADENLDDDEEEN